MRVSNLWLLFVCYFVVTAGGPKVEDEDEPEPPEPFEWTDE